MADRGGPLHNLEEKKQFLFSYRKQIARGRKFIRSGNKRQAIVRSVVKGKIKPFDPRVYERLMKGEITETDIKCDFWYDENGTITPHLPGLSTFTNRRDMPPFLRERPEELWQLDRNSPFPEEVDIVVFEDQWWKGYIKPKGDLGTSVTRDNLIEMLSCLPWKKYSE